MPGGAQALPSRSGLAADRGIGLHLAECPACGVAQLLGKPVRYWRSVIRSVGVSGDMLAFRRAQLRDFAQRHKLAGKSGIEFGCGDGAYLAVLAETGLRATGLEYAAKSVRACLARGLHAQQGFAEKNRLVAGGPFDAFFMFNHLEHIPHPRDCLATVRANLAEGAVGIIEAPNFDMIARHSLFAELIADHLFYFTEATLRRTLENNGFAVLSCAPVWHDYILSAEVAKRPRADLSGLRAARADAADAFAAFFARHARVAAWGAGHQAFTMLALLPDVSKIAYIADSAPFKQGRFSPVTHLPILAPEALRENPVDALIVMGAGYSDEIARIAHARYAQRNIVIFRDNRLVEYTPDAPDMPNTPDTPDTAGARP
jgi:SAM-dependent methyltransferase